MDDEGPGTSDKRCVVGLTTLWGRLDNKLRKARMSFELSCYVIFYRKRRRKRLGSRLVYVKLV